MMAICLLHRNVLKNNQCNISAQWIHCFLLQTKYVTDFFNEIIESRNMPILSSISTTYLHAAGEEGLLCICESWLRRPSSLVYEVRVQRRDSELSWRGIASCKTPIMLIHLEPRKVHNFFLVVRILLPFQTQSF